MEGLAQKSITVIPGQALRGEVELPGDKSISHRAALFAALADGTSRVDHFLVAGVTRAMLQALKELGVQWELEGPRLTIHGKGLSGPGDRSARAPHLDCGNSATTLRLLAGALAAAGTAAVLDGSEGLRRRPMNRIVQPLQEMGVRIESTGGYAPLQLQPSPMPLRAVEHELKVASAQVKSCLLLAGLSAGQPLVVREPGPSRDHTERMLGNMGVQVKSRRQLTGGSTVYESCLTPPDYPLQPLTMAIPGDFSAAAFLMVAAAITPGSEIQLKGVGLNSTRTGLLDALLQMGADIEVFPSEEQAGEPVGDIRVRYAELQGCVIEGPLVVRMIDEFPAFAVAAASARGETIVREAAELRLKESDRIAAVVGELRTLDVQIEERPDGFIVQGGRQVQGGEVSANGDHRLAMSLAIAGLNAQSPVTVQGTEMIQESFPGFPAALISLGASMLA